MTAKPQKTRRKAKPEKPALPAISKEEIERTKGDIERTRMLPHRVKIRCEDTGKAVSVGPPHDDHAAWTFRLQAAFGSKSEQFRHAMMVQIGQLTRKGDEAAAEVHINAAVAILSAVEPRNELEAALAVQMFGTHMLATKALASAQHAEMLPQYEAHAAVATKASRTFTAQLEALAKLRGSNARQTIVVEHRQQFIAPGAQGVMGDVHTSHRGGGGAAPKPTQSHTPEPVTDVLAALAFAPGTESPSMWSEDAQGEPLPSPGGARAPQMSPPWRDEPGSAQGGGERGVEGRSPHQRDEGAAQVAGSRAQGLARTGPGALTDAGFEKQAMNSKAGVAG